MRCGKGINLNLPHSNGLVATRTNALWQRIDLHTSKARVNRRNPHECAVAKVKSILTESVIEVATRTNALWQRSCRQRPFLGGYVATRTNALWQSVGWNKEEFRAASRNPHECAVAKTGSGII